MSSGDNKKPKVQVRPLTNTELALYCAMVLLTAIAQFMQSGKSIAETLAWIIIYAFFLGVVFFGWARTTVNARSESEK